MDHLMNWMKYQKNSNKTTGADSEKIAVLRKGRPGLAFIWAAAHLAARYPGTEIL